MQPNLIEHSPIVDKTNNRFESFEDFNLYTVKHTRGGVRSNSNHSNSSLSLLVGGIASVDNRGYKYIVDSGNFIYRPKWCSTSNKLGTETASCFNITIKPSFWNKSNRSHMTKDKILFFNKVDTELFKLYCNFLSSGQHDVLGIQGFEYLDSLFGKDIQVTKYGRAVWISRIIEIIKEQPQMSFSLEYLSNEVNLHPTYLCRKFKEKHGYSLGQFINQVRLEKAVLQILRNPKTRFADVCFDLGFYDKAHFSSNSKDIFGISPKTFRNLTKS